MHIGIDISQLAYKGSGVARYTSYLIDALLTYDKKNTYTFFYSSLRQNLPPEIEKKITSLKRYMIPPTFLNFLWNNLHVGNIESFVGNVDVFFSSDWIEPPAKKAKKITTIHDLVIYKYPQTSHQTIISTQKKRLSWVSKESSLIMVDSESTKKDVMEILKIDLKKLRVVYPPVLTKQPTAEMVEQTLKKYNVKKPYILSVGKLEPRKNIPMLIDAFELSKASKDTTLLIVGPTGWTTQRFKTGENVHPLGFVPDDELYALYKEAEFFIFPSLYEGFGYPVVEAMSLGCPVAASETSSVGEIAKGYALTFNPLKKKEMIDAIDRLHDDASLRKELSEKGLKRAKDFSLENFAKQLLQIFDAV